MADVLVRVKAYCKCGTPLKEVFPASTGIGWFTVEPCPACIQGKFEKKIEEKTQADYVFPPNEDGPWGSKKVGD